MNSAPSTMCPPASEIGSSGNAWAVTDSAANTSVRPSSTPACRADTRKRRRTHREWCICRKYNARVWIVLAAAFTVFSADLSAAWIAGSDKQSRVLPLPAGKTLSIEVTVGTVRIEGGDRGDAEITIERHAPAATQLARLPITIDDTATRASIRVTQLDGGTDPALRA